MNNHHSAFITSRHLCREPTSSWHAICQAFLTGGVATGLGGGLAVGDGAGTLHSTGLELPPRLYREYLESLGPTVPGAATHEVGTAQEDGHLSEARLQAWSCLCKALSISLGGASPTTTVRTGEEELPLVVCTSVIHVPRQAVDRGLADHRAAVRPGELQRQPQADANTHIKSGEGTKGGWQLSTIHPSNWCDGGAPDITKGRCVLHGWHPAVRRCW